MAVTLNTTVGPVTIKEMYEGYEAGIDLTRGPYVNKKYLCPDWPSTFPVANALMGGGVPPVGRHACPESTNLRCLNAVVQPKGEFDARDSGRPRFNLPIVSATYAIPTWSEQATDDPSANQSFPNEISPGQPYTYMDQSIDWDTETIKLPGRAYTFQTLGGAVDTPVARTIAVAQFVLVRRWQKQLPYANVTAYLNKLNNATFLGQPAGQIKFRKARARRSAFSDGTASQEVELVFQWREYDHNMQHRPDKFLFEKIVDSAGNTPYGYSDLTQLLR